MSQGDEDQFGVDPTSICQGTDDAVNRYEQARKRITENPRDVEAIDDQASAMLFLGAGGSARCRLMEAAELCDRNDTRWLGIRLQTARICYNEGLIVEALELLDGLERIADPRAHKEILLLRGRSLISASRYEEARSVIRDIAVSGNLGPAAQVLIAELDVAGGERDRASTRLRHLLRNPELDSWSRAGMGFTLAGLLEKLGDHDAAFEAAQAANDALNPDFDAAGFEAETERLLAWCTPERIGSLPISTDHGTRSVFIVGMPRSGTSLLEQIISSHPRGDGIGERFEFNMFSTLLAHRTGLINPAFLGTADSSMLDEFARDYRTMERSISPTADRVTNKALGLDAHLPLISRVLPGSRAVLLQRRPLDNLLSIFMNPINPRVIPWSCSLDGLIAGRRRFDRLTRHWHEVLEMETLPLRYEDLVDDSEARIREVLDFLEIEYDPATLDFHTSDRVVMTPSRNQVSRPINRDAVDRWRCYERHIGPLVDAFGE